MPNRDGSGPTGQGSMTGWGAGDCAGDDRPVNRGFGRGLGRGLGRRFGWRGQGRLWGMGARNVQQSGNTVLDEINARLDKLENQE